MSQLDNQAQIRGLDQNNYFSHILDTSQQIQEGFVLSDDLTIPALYAQAKQVLLLANGEMLPVALTISALMHDYARVPCLIESGYTLPYWVSSDTLVVGLDYYGTNEQVLATFREAAKKRARLLSISVGGELGVEARRNRAPYIELAYGAPARSAFPYIFSCVASVFKKLDFVELKATTVDESAVLCRSLLDNIEPDVPQFRNGAKQLAEKITAHRTVIVGSGPLQGIAKKWQMVMATNGKTVITASSLSEFNDTIINGLSVPAKTAETPLVVMLQSKYDHARNKVQQALTYQVAQAQRFSYEQVFMHPSGSLFGEIMLANLMGEMVSYYVAWLRDKDPSATDVTTFIKEQLASEGEE